MGVIKRRLIVRGEWGLEPHATKPADDDAVELTPTANYGYNKASNLWLPQPVGTSGAPVVEVEEENEYVMKTLALAAAFVATEIKDAGGNPLAGRSLTIWINDGSWNLYFDSGSHDPIPIAPITYPAMITFVREFTSIWASNGTSQAKAAILYIGKRI